MTTPTTLLTDSLTNLNEAEDSLKDAKNYAQSATSDADRAQDYANDARSNADEADDYCGYCQDHLEELRANLEELGTLLQDPEDKLANDMARHQVAVMKRHKLGWDAQRIANDLSISVVLVDLIVAQSARETASA